MTNDTGSHDVLGPWLALVNGRREALDEARFCFRMAEEDKEEGAAEAWTALAGKHLLKAQHFEERLSLEYPRY